MQATKVFDHKGTLLRLVYGDTTVEPYWLQEEHWEEYEDEPAYTYTEIRLQPVVEVLVAAGVEIVEEHLPAPPKKPRKRGRPRRRIDDEPVDPQAWWHKSAELYISRPAIGARIVNIGIAPEKS